jgi:ubiquinone/menaquinone biosynthesis C-methylase UbiE
MAPQQRKRVDYGIDAPQVILWNAVGASLYLAFGVFAALGGIPHFSGRALIVGGCIWLASPLLMLLSSKVGKLAQRDVVLDGIGFRGDEQVLDIVTGHGLMAIGAARRVPRGKVIGVDIWQQGDQADNARQHTERNAELEGVSANCAIQDGDARQLPFGAEQFDIVLANFALHNIPTDAGKRQACCEIARVLKPGGRLYNYDMLFTTGPFVRHLRAAGLAVRQSGLQFRTFPPGFLVTAVKPGTAAQG